MKNRVYYLDTARALCMLWIIGIWHIGAYVEKVFLKSNIYTNPITVGVLATFTFISGKFLGKSLHSAGEVIAFYIRRLKRFYPLFLLACVSLYLLPITFQGTRVYIDSFRQFWLTITGLACFVQPMPATVWYFCMILIFYALTPLITRWEKVRSRIIVSCLLYVVFILTYLCGITEERVVLYFPIYCLGLMNYGKTEVAENFNWKLCFGGIIGAVLSTCLIAKVGENPFVQLLPALTYGVVIIELGKLFTKRKSVTIFSWIAYASMCAYLFHRQYFKIIMWKVGRISVFIEDFVMLPLFLVGCYGVQKCYDTIVHKLNEVKK